LQKGSDKILSGNIIVVAKGNTSLPKDAISSHHIEMTNEGLKLHGRRYRDQGTGNHKYSSLDSSVTATGALILSSTRNATWLHLWGIDKVGLERATLLFPFRTGLSVPEWIVLGSNYGGVLSAGFWGHERMPWNEAMSWLS